MACKGVHQLAFRFVGRRFQSKLTQDLRESDVQAFLKDRLGSEVVLWVLRWMISYLEGGIKLRRPSDGVLKLVRLFSELVRCLDDDGGEFLTLQKEWWSSNRSIFLLCRLVVCRRGRCEKGGAGTASEGRTEADRYHCEIHMASKRGLLFLVILYQLPR